MTNTTRCISTVIDDMQFPKLHAFAGTLIDMQLADVRDMLRLPLPGVGLDAGHNFAAAAALANLIAGASVWFYDASENGLHDRRDRTRRYREILKHYWPWDDGEVVDARTGFEVLYGHVRNPLAHAFGLPGPHDGALIQLRKSPLAPEQIAELDLSATRPAWVGPTIEPMSTTAPGGAYVISVPGFYWGVRQLLRRVLSDAAQAPAAELLADTLVRFMDSAGDPSRAPA